MFWDYKNKKVTLNNLYSVFSHFMYLQIHYTKLYRLTCLTKQPIVFENLHRQGFFLFHYWPQFTPRPALATYSENLMSGILTFEFLVKLTAKLIIFWNVTAFSLEQRYILGYHLCIFIFPYLLFFSCSDIDVSNGRRVFGK